MESISHETVENVCILCRTDKRSEVCTSATNTGYVSLMEAVKKRNNAIDHKYGAFLDGYLSLKLEDVRYHRKCYSEFTNKTLISRLKSRSDAPDIEPEQNSVSNLTDHALLSMIHGLDSGEQPERAVVTQTTDWSICVICQKAKPNNKDHLRSVSADTAAKIESFAEIDNLLYDRIKDTNLTHSQVQHHGLCLLDLERRYKQKTTAPPKKQSAFNGLCVELRASVDGKVLKLQDVFKRFCTLCEQMNEDVPPSFKSRLSTFKEKLCASIGDIFYFYQPMNRGIHERQMLMIPTKSLHKIIEMADADVSSTYSNDSSNETNIMTVVHSALICRKQLFEQPGFMGLNVSKQSARSVVPEMLQLYLEVLMKGQEAVDDYFDSKSIKDDDDDDYCDVETDESGDEDGSDDSKEENISTVADEDLSNRILSIAQDIVYVSSKGKKLTPKHIGLALAMAMHQKTRSRKLVSLLNKAGHCATYKQVLQIEHVTQY